MIHHFAKVEILRNCKERQQSRFYAIMKVQDKIGLSLLNLSIIASFVFLTCSENWASGNAIVRTSYDLQRHSTVFISRINKFVKIRLKIQSKTP